MKQITQVEKNEIKYKKEIFKLLHILIINDRRENIHKTEQKLKSTKSKSIKL